MLSYHQTSLRDTTLLPRAEMTTKLGKEHRLLGDSRNNCPIPLSLRADSSSRGLRSRTFLGVIPQDMTTLSSQQAMILGASLLFQLPCQELHTEVPTLRKWILLNIVIFTAPAFLKCRFCGKPQIDLCLPHADPASTEGTWMVLFWYLYRYWEDRPGD